MRLAETVRQHLGWCPNRMTASRSVTIPADNLVLSIPAGEWRFTMQDAIMDYGSTGMSIPLFTIILAYTITGLFAIMRYSLFESWSSLGILLLSIFILGAAVWMFFQDMKKATVEFTPDTLTIRRHLFKPVIISKDAITTVEIRKNVHHSRRWFFRGAMVIFLITIIPSILFSGQSQYISRLISRVSYTVFVVYYLAIIVFFVLLFYHAYIRSRYSQIVAIHTNSKKIVGLYGNDPGKMYEMLYKWRTRAV